MWGEGTLVIREGVNVGSQDDVILLQFVGSLLECSDDVIGSERTC